MRITRISVDGLFGMFNHDIGMKMSDRITIIHGMNGYGKTTILRMANALFNKRYSDLRNTPFKEFRVELEDGRIVSVSKLSGDRAIISKKQRSHGIQIRLLKKGKEVEKADFPTHVSEGHCHIAVEKSDVDVVSALTGRNDGGAFWLSRSQAAIICRHVSNRFCRSTW